MTKGRKAKSAVAHILSGNASKLSAAEIARRLEHERKVGVACSFENAPDHVAAVPAALAEWNLISPLLAKRGLVSDLDANVLSMYCLAWARYTFLESKFLACGESAYIDVTPKGFETVSAISIALSRATEIVLKLGAKIGLAPDDRAALIRDIAAAPPQGDLFDQYATGTDGKGHAPAPSKASSYFPA